LTDAHRIALWGVAADRSQALRLPIPSPRGTTSRVYWLATHLPKQLGWQRACQRLRSRGFTTTGLQMIERRLRGPRMLSTVRLPRGLLAMRVLAYAYENATHESHYHSLSVTIAV